MSQELLSSSWHRVAGLRPRRAVTTQLHRHEYRGQRWYVLQNRATARTQLLSPAAHLLIGLMDGKRTVQEIWDEAAHQLGDDCPTQDETIRVLGMLYKADSMACDVPPDTAETFRRVERRESAEFRKRFMQPTSFKLPLVDPDKFLDRWVGAVAPVFTAWGALVWCAVVGLAIAVGTAHWDEFTQDAGSRLMSGQNLMLMWIAYPFVKALHELGHGFAAKTWGAEVHEMGVMFLVFMPIPYVDASEASVFPDKHRRMVVSAAGVGIELMVAALAMLVWLTVEPGAIRSIAYGVVWISGASTLLFNANPLLRFDGYFVLADWLEIPNLGARANEYLGYLVQRRLFGMKHVRTPANAPGEAPWFFFYGITAFVYKLLLSLGIALFVAGNFFVVGVVIAGLSVSVQMVLPAARKIGEALFAPRYGEKRARIVATSAVVLGGLGAILCFLPLPLYTLAQGVVWLPEQAQLRAGSDAFVTELLVEQNTRVKPGDAIVLASDPLLDAEVAVLRAKLRGLQARHFQERAVNIARSKLTEEEIETAEAALARALERAHEVVIRSPLEGELILPFVDDLVGRFVKQGEAVGYVLGSGEPTARVVLSEADIELVRERTEAIEVRLASNVAHVRSARISRMVPGASLKLPNRALGSSGGGAWPIDSKDPDGLQTLVPVFELDLTLDEAEYAGSIGELVYVRFDHGSEPLALRAYRGLRRLLLSRLSV